MTSRAWRALAISAWCSVCTGQVRPMLPQFKDYPATVQLIGPPKKPLLVHPEQRLYKTRITQGIERGEGLLGYRGQTPPAPNFAGAFYAVTWGCGSDGCASLAVVDGRTGTVYGPPPDASPPRTGFVATPRTHECTGIDLRPDSRLLFIENTDYTSGSPKCERTYYEWQNGSYRFLQKALVKPSAPSVP